MSFVNLCANLMCPEYPSMYLVGSAAFQQRFDGVVGTLTNDSYEKCVLNSSGNQPSLQTRTKKIFGLIVFTGLAALVPIAVIGLISRFQSGSHSTATQQIWVSLWLLYGVYFGVISPLLQRAFEERPILNTWAMGLGSMIARLLAVLTFLLGFGAVLGFIRVGQMIVAYGVCIPLPVT
jgi:hypothetical protein